MMEQMVSEMDIDEWSSFVKSMMKTCLNTIFANLPNEDAKKLAQEMLTSHAEELKKV